MQPPGKPVLFAASKCVTSKTSILLAALPVYLLFYLAPTHSSCCMSLHISVSPCFSTYVPVRLLPLCADPRTYPPPCYSSPHTPSSSRIPPHPLHPALLPPASRLAPLPLSRRWAVTWRCSSCATSQPGTWTQDAATVSPGSPPGAPVTTAPDTWPTSCAPTPT